MTTIVGSCNLRYTLPDDAFEHGLRLALAEHPDLLALQEAGTNRDPVIERVCRELGYGWVRPKSPNGDPVMPLLYRLERYRLRTCHAVLLARREYVGHLPGRKDRLPASWATEVLLDDLASDKPDGQVVAVDVYHLTAEVQQGSGYRKDPAHLLRVVRHRREKRRLGRRLRMHKRRGRVAFGVGDGNFDGMTIGGFVSCWDTRHPGIDGTLGNRFVDIIFAATRARWVRTVKTPSDHDAVVANY